MDSADATPFGSWASIRSYFTPATLFIVVNLVIGTIALTSRSHQRRRREHHDDAHHHHEPLHPHQQQEYHYYQQQPLYATPPPAPAPLARTSSVLDRLRCIGLYRFRSGDFPPEYGAAAADPGANHDVFSPVEEETTKQQAHYARSRSEPAPPREEKRAATRMKKSGSEVRKAQVARAPTSRVVEAVAEDEAVDARAEDFTGSFRREPLPQKAEYHYQEEYVPPVATASLARTSSVLNRLRSMSLYGFLAPEQPAAASAPARDVFATPADEKKQAHAHYDRSRSEPKREQDKEKKQAEEARMAKSSSAARKAAAPSLAEAETDKCVDARAEAFINNFKRERSQQQVHHDREEFVVPPPAPLARTSSVLDRLRSFGQYLRSSDLVVPEDPAPASAPAADGKKQAASQYGRSRSEPAREQGKEEKKQGAEARMSKSSSEPGMAEEEPAEADQCVDAKADDFINKFRQQLQLQRLNSLLNYKEMLNLGGSKQ